MDLNHVTVFLQVVDAGSFTAAGDALGLPKSSVSRIVAKLEEELGVRLLQRTTRTLSLTETGRGYYERARKSLASLQEAASLASDAGTAPRGIVRLTAPFDVGSSELAEILARFHERYPEIHVEVVLTNRYLDLIEDGIDVAIRAGRLEDSSLVARKVGTTDFALFASAPYLERKGVPETIADLHDHDCVLFRARGGRTEWKLAGPDGEEQRVTVKGALTSDELVFVRQAIEAGVGIGLLPLFVQARCARAGFGERFVRVLPDHVMRGGAIHVVVPTLEFSPLRVTLLRDFLVENLTRLYREEHAAQQT